MRECEFDDLKRLSKNELVYKITDGRVREADLNAQLATVRAALVRVSTGGDGFAKQAHELKDEVERLIEARRKDAIVMQALAHALLGTRP